MKENARKDKKSQEGTVQLQLPMRDLLRESLHDLIVGVGLQALAVLLETERAEICGPRYRHDPQRVAHRTGYDKNGELVLGGRRVSVPRPRGRTMQGQEVSLPSWEQFSAEDPLERRAVEQMVLGVTTRKYARSLEQLPPEVDSRGTSKSAVSRRFVAATSAQFDTLMARDLSDLDLAVLMLDGVHYGDHVVLVALGIDTSGTKHVLGLAEGATENAVACKQLLTNLRDRGMRTERSMLVVIDGGKALAAAIRAVFGDRAILQRCQVHKKRNVMDQLPQHMRKSVSMAMSQAYRQSDPKKAKRQLQNLANRLKNEYPGAAASLLEGLDDTLAVQAFKLPAALERTLATTNAIENLIGTAQRVSRNVKRWRGGTMMLRWVAAGVLEAETRFRKLRGCAGMPILVKALRARDRQLDGANSGSRQAVA
jgi:transposase-like protein